MSPSPVPSWIDKVLEKQSAVPTDGDVIVAQIGSAKNVNVGKNIQQIITETLGPRKADDSKEIAAAIAQLRSEFAKLAPAMPEMEKYVGEDKLKTIETELKKEEGQPSGDLIRSAGDWLVQNVPRLGSALVSAFLPDSVGRVLAKAGPDLIQWIASLRQQVFG